MATVLAQIQNDPELVAAVDLGSNSFHLLIGRVQSTPAGPQISPLDSLKDVVRLASGLSADKRLDAASQARAISALQRFGERLRAFDTQHVRAVATNTFRVAKNGAEFLKTCEAALGFPIEVIAGKEEARLIYNGVAHSLAADGARRLVIDIGGGSTEFIIGTNYEAELLESVFVGCIRFSRDFFPGGDITRSGFKDAIFEARRSIQVISAAYRRHGWERAVASSGSARAIQDVLVALGDTSHRITLEGMEHVRSLLIKAGRVEDAALPGLKVERMPVFVGGLVIMMAAFEELKIEEMHYADGALRLGVLYDVLGRARHDDMRIHTVEQFMKRYQVDRAQAARVGALAQSLWMQLSGGTREEKAEMSALIGWSASLLEIGHSISHNSFHKHTAYILAQADMPGFSRRDQRIMSTLAMGHVGKLGKVMPLVGEAVPWAAVLCLRLAAVFFRNRSDAKLPSIALVGDGRQFELSLPKAWLSRHPLTQHSLDQDRLEWRKVGVELGIRAG